MTQAARKKNAKTGRIADLDAILHRVRADLRHCDECERIALRCLREIQVGSKSWAHDLGCGGRVVRSWASGETRIPIRRAIDILRVSLAYLGAYELLATEIRQFLRRVSAARG